MKLYIPACGDRIRLTKEWKFDLYLERRNLAFAKSKELIPEKFSYMDCWNGRTLKKVQTSVPKGTVLECDRVYIRTFNKSKVKVESDFDSITWKIITEKGKCAGRFWTKLPSCYDIEYKQDADDRYRDRVKLIKEVLGS
jgi:hypothetical protein